MTASVTLADIKFDCRYIKQYHEVSFLVPRALIDRRGRVVGIIPRFMREREWAHTGISELRLVDVRQDEAHAFSRRALRQGETDAAGRARSPT